MLCYSVPLRFVPYKEVSILRVNGEKVCLEKSLPLAAYLAARGFDCRLVAVERNGQIVPKADYEKVELQEEDSLEIVRFVGGG